MCHITVLNTVLLLCSALGLFYCYIGSGTYPIPVPDYSQRTCHSTLMGVLCAFGQHHARRWRMCRVTAVIIHQNVRITPS
jgi:hypothetical protein